VLKLVVRFSSDCAAPLRVLLAGTVAMMLLLMLMQGYVRRTAGKAERVRRTGVVLLTFVPLCGSALFLHFVSICSLRPPCREGVDLNCTGGNPRLYAGAALFLMIAAFASALVECGYRIVRRRRQPPRSR
jgi:hypothetical protein